MATRSHAMRCDAIRILHGLDNAEYYAYVTWYKDRDTQRNENEYDNEMKETKLLTFGLLITLKSF